MCLASVSVTWTRLAWETQVSVMCLAICVCDIMNKAGMLDTGVYYVSGGLCLWHDEKGWHVWHRCLLHVWQSVSVTPWTRLACVTQVSIMCLAVCVCNIMNKASMCDTGVCYVSGSLRLWHHEQGWLVWHRCLLCVWRSVSVTSWPRPVCVTQMSIMCLAVCICVPWTRPVCVT